MKIGIIGSGPEAAEAAIRFCDIGADVRVFASSPWLSRYQAISSDEAYARELVEKLDQADLKFSLVNVKRIHKARIKPHDSKPNGRTRLSDMFRIVVSENPQQGVLKQVDENQEVFNKLGDEVLASLQEPVESFHDVDLVVCCFDELNVQPGLSSSGAQALNESRAQQFIIDYNNWWQVKPKLGHTLIVGDEDQVLNFASKLENSMSYLHLPREDKPSRSFEVALNKSHTKWNEDKELFQKKMHEWRDLEDYVKVKVPKPVEPKARIHQIKDASIVALDHLIDRDGLFVSLEQHIDEDIMTINVDQVINARSPKWDYARLQGLAIEPSQNLKTINESEPGFYCFESGNDKKVKQQVEHTLKDIMRWFRPAGDQ